MIASSIREGDEVVDLLLSKEADAAMKSKQAMVRTSWPKKFHGKQSVKLSDADHPLVLRLQRPSKLLISQYLSAPSLMRPYH